MNANGVMTRQSITKIIECVRRQVDLKDLAMIVVIVVCVDTYKSNRATRGTTTGFYMKNVS